MIRLSAILNAETNYINSKQMGCITSACDEEPPVRDSHVYNTAWAHDMGGYHVLLTGYANQSVEPIK